MQYENANEPTKLGSRGRLCRYLSSLYPGPTPVSTAEIRSVQASSSHLNSVLRHLQKSKETGNGQYLALCPAHDDTERSLSIGTGDDGRALIHCFAGCSSDAILESIGLSTKDLFPENAPRYEPNRRAKESISVRELAEHRKIPVQFLREVGVTGLPNGEIGIEYRDESGRAVQIKRRTRHTAKNGSYWPKDVPLMAYGQERLPDVSSQGDLCVVEGESDCWALWYNGYDALGIPGASATKVLTKQHLANVNRIFAFQEPDQGGARFIEGLHSRVKELGWNGEFRVVKLSDTKDPSELHMQDPKAFREKFDQALKESELIGLGDADSTMPKIVTSGRHLRDVSEDCWKLILQANNPPSLFRRGGVLMEVTNDDRGNPNLRTVDRTRLKGILDRHADFVIEKKGKFLPSRPPYDVIDDMLANRELPLPLIRGIVECPQVAEGGSIRTESGYDPATYQYIFLKDDVEIPTVADYPSQTEIAEAKDILLNELLGDFSFASDADTANAVALLLLPFVRNMIQGPIPLHMIEAPSPGTGKSLLASVIAILATGRGPSVLPEAKSEEEWRKRITAMLLAASSINLIDNVGSKLDSTALSALLTTEMWSDRILGKNQIVSVEVTGILVATANNPQLSLEIARRTASIRIDSFDGQPWLRKGFRHENLLDWAKRYRGQLMRAVLTLILNWISAGRPKGSKVLGSYESWSKNMGGILEANGIPDFLGNLERIYEEADQESQEWSEFVELWYARFGSDPVDTDLLFGLIKREMLLPEIWIDKADKSSRIRLGKSLLKMKDRVFKGLRIIRSEPDRHRKVARYQIKQMREVREVKTSESDETSSHSQHPGGVDDSTKTSIDENFSRRNEVNDIPQLPATSRNPEEDWCEGEL